MLFASTAYTAKAAASRLGAFRGRRPVRSALCQRRPSCALFACVFNMLWLPAVCTQAAARCDAFYSPAPAHANAFRPFQNCTTPNPLSETFDALLRQFHQLATDNGIPYSITWGTYVGYKRHGSYIPYDGDIDVHVGKESIAKLHALTACAQCTLASKLAANPVRRNSTPRLVLYPFPNATFGPSRKRWNCNGMPASRQVDACSFNGPLARLVHQGPTRKIWLDLFLFSLERDPAVMRGCTLTHQVEVSSGPFSAYATARCASELPPTEPCSLNGISTMCFGGDTGEELLVAKYGPNYMIPNKPCLT
eukprot:gene4128-13657_t